MKLFVDGQVLEAYEALDYALELANKKQIVINVFNWAPGCHKHNSLYLPVCPDPVDTPLAEAYGG